MNILRISFIVRIQYVRSSAGVKLCRLSEDSCESQQRLCHGPRNSFTIIHMNHEERGIEPGLDSAYCVQASEKHRITNWNDKQDEDLINTYKYRYIHNSTISARNTCYKHDKYKQWYLQFLNNSIRVIDKTTFKEPYLMHYFIFSFVL